MIKCEYLDLNKIIDFCKKIKKLDGKNNCSIMIENINFVFLNDKDNSKINKLLEEYSKIEKITSINEFTKEFNHFKNLLKKNNNLLLTIRVDVLNNIKIFKVMDENLNGKIYFSFDVDSSYPDVYEIFTKELKISILSSSFGEGKVITLLNKILENNGQI